MSLFRRFELLEPFSPSFHYKEASIHGSRPSLLFPFDDLVMVEEHCKSGLGLGSRYVIDTLSPSPLDFALQCRFPHPTISTPELYDVDLLQIERSLVFPASIQRVQKRVETEACLRSLADRVAALELGFERTVRLPLEAEKRDRKYKWEAEVKGEKEGRKWTWVTEAKADGQRRLKCEVDVSEKGKETRTYAFEASSALARKGEKKEKKVKQPKTRVVEITDPELDQGGVVLRKAFARGHCKGKGKKLSPQDAASIIQMNFRAYLIRRSQVLRGLRALAVAKAKLKEIRALFSNFQYRRCIANDAEEHQKFSEKIIVLLLTVDAIEGLDYMVRATRKSMMEELEAMLEVIDPLPDGKLGSLKRRKFDLPEFSAFQREMASGVGAVVRLINQDEDSSSA